MIMELNSIAIRDKFLKKNPKVKPHYVPNTFGLFITLQKYGGDGFIPLKYLPKDYYDVFDNNTILSGRNNGLNIKIGEIINAILIEANPLNGRLILKYSGKD